jgi:thiol-disulfide isomerase/thioredoxin
MPRPRTGLLAGTILLTIIAIALPLPASDADFPFPNRQKPPQLPQNLTWLNTAGPLELRELRGKFVLLDFWTYCCINCMHILPELHKLEQAWPKNLVVIGVHSAKFSTEQQTPNILAAIQRYKIAHPVVNDARHEFWDAFGVQSWPTLVLIDPEGNVVATGSGETTFEQIDKLLRAAMPYYRQRHLLDETPLRFDIGAAAAKRTVQSTVTPLRFPGKIVADEAGDRLFISDSNHNRIVVARLDGRLLEVIGSGAAGQKDGDFAAAEFNQPQGMALRGDNLFVADTENHEIRRVDLAAKTVATVAGTGKQARGNVVARRSLPRHTALSSPWDVLVHGDGLFIAMAGCHQIWLMKFDGTAIGPYAGNGAEDIVDGPLLPVNALNLDSASFAQPSGLATDGTWLYVVDSEGSSVRAVPLSPPRRQVRTVVGTAKLATGRLFTFGDADGPAETARFQHPLGVIFYGGKLYVADTYNSKIRAVDPADGSVQTLAGTGQPGHDNQPASFFEPGGLTAAADKLYVADTNNHLIRTIDLKTSQVATLTIAGLKPPEPSAPPKRPLAGEKLPPMAVRAEQGQVRLHVELELPLGYAMNPLAPLEYTVDVAGVKGPVSREGLGKSVRIDKPAAEFDITLPVNAAKGRDTIRVAVDYYYCREGAEAICKVGSAAWIVPLEVSAAAGQTVVRLRQRAK